MALASSRARRPIVAGLLAALIVGCAGPDPAPFQEPVPGASSISDWAAEEPPQLNAADEGLTPEAIVDALVQQEIGSLPGAEVSRQLTTGDGMVTGYLRATLPASDHPLRARDTRVQMEEIDAGWQITALEHRYHCATAVASPEFCE